MYKLITTILLLFFLKSSNLVAQGAIPQNSFTNIKIKSAIPAIIKEEELPGREILAQIELDDYIIDDFSENIKPKKWILTYPNPVVDELNVAVDRDLIDGNISLYDSFGKLLLIVTPEDQFTKIKLNTYPCGIYYCVFKLIEEPKVNTQRILIAR